MAMIAGTATITVNPDSSVIYGGSGLALAFAQARFDAIVSGMQALRASSVRDGVEQLTARDVYNALVASAPSTAAIAQIDATAIVGYLQAHAVAHVTVESLGRTPNPNNANTPIVAPSAPVDIPIQ